MKIRLLNRIGLLIGAYTRDVSIRSNKMTSKGHRYYDRDRAESCESTWLEQIVPRDIACKSATVSVTKNCESYIVSAEFTMTQHATNLYKWILAYDDSHRSICPRFLGWVVPLPAKIVLENGKSRAIGKNVAQRGEDRVYISRVEIEKRDYLCERSYNLCSLSQDNAIFDGTLRGTETRAPKRRERTGKKQVGAITENDYCKR